MHRGRRHSRRIGGAVAATLALAAVGACIPDVVPSPSTLPRCAALDAGCGADGQDDCCAADPVPGGQYNRINDVGYPARVDAFALDRYEVTVGRFRAFVTGYTLDEPRAGDGASAVLGAPSGWDATWDAALPADQAALGASLGCSSEYATWTDTPGENEDKPIDCVTWYLAFAFCAWDGGRLPTEAEWNYAAAGGDEQRPYPWGTTGPDATLAVSGCQSSTVSCPIPNVGSLPAGQGKWKQMDLAGSMAEWTLDYFSTLPTDCADKCVQLTDGMLGRDLRGGDFTHDNSQLLTTYRVGILPTDAEAFIGFRCARDQ
jgi:formylglycine-generating enzyme